MHSANERNVQQGSEPTKPLFRSAQVHIVDIDIKASCSLISYGLFNWIITVTLFALASSLVDGFRLKNGLSSALLGAVAYSVISAVFIRILGLGDVGVLRAAGA